MGFSLPVAGGAAYGAPNARVVATMGDGSFGFAVGGLATIVRKKLPITLIGYGGRYLSIDFNRSDHARIAEALGSRRGASPIPPISMPRPGLLSHMTDHR